MLFSKAVKFTWEFVRVIDIRNLDKKIRLLSLAVFFTFFGANLLFTVFTVFLKEYFKASSQFVFLLYSMNSLSGNIAFLQLEWSRPRNLTNFY